MLRAGRCSCENNHWAGEGGEGLGSMIGLGRLGVGHTKALYFIAQVNELSEGGVTTVELKFLPQVVVGTNSCHQTPDAAYTFGTGRPLVLQSWVNNAGLVTDLFSLLFIHHTLNRNEQHLLHF